MAQDASLATVVLFDSVCLQCHEGECSGRLALRMDKNPEGLAGHVRGYAGQQSEGVVAELQGLMGRLKTACVMPPPPVPVPTDGWWRPAMLRSLTVDDGRRMFVPLGLLDQGKQSLTIRSKESGRIRLQVLTQGFDIVVDQDVDIGGDKGVTTWRVDDSGPHFLRLVSRNAIGEITIHNGAIR